MGPVNSPWGGSPSCCILHMAGSPCSSVSGGSDQPHDHAQAGRSCIRQVAPQACACKACVPCFCSRLARLQVCLRWGSSSLLVLGRVRRGCLTVWACQLGAMQTYESDSGMTCFCAGVSKCAGTVIHNGRSKCVLCVGGEDFWAGTCLCAYQNCTMNSGGDIWFRR